MATKDEKIAKAIKAFLRVGQQWDIGRQGGVLSLNGTRVGTWKWDTNRMVLSSINNTSGKKFKKMIKKIQRNGVMTTALDSTLKKDEEAPDILYRTTALSKLSPGELDTVLRDNGYFTVDFNIPSTSEGEEGAEITNPQSDVQE